MAIILSLGVPELLNHREHRGREEYYTGGVGF
jgi:hypothetical protein